MNYLLTMILIFLFKTSHQDDLSTATSSIPSTTEFINTTEITTTTAANDPCQANPCMNNGTCLPFDFGEKFRCICQPNFYGDTCAQEARACLPNPCLNNGSCSQFGMSYYCFCLPKFHGFNCEYALRSCFPNPCNNQNCTIIGKSYLCSCSQGWTGPNCDKYVNPCSSNPCQFYETCSVSGNLFGSAYYCTSASSNYGLIVFKFVGIPLIMIAFFTGILFICSRNRIYRVFKGQNRSLSNTTTIRRSTSGQIVYIISSNIDRMGEHAPDSNSVNGVSTNSININLTSNDLLDYNEAIRLSTSSNPKDSSVAKEEELPSYQEHVNSQNINTNTTPKS